MRLVTFLFVVSILFDYGATLPCLTMGSKKDFANTRNALKSLESYLSKTVSTLKSQISKTVSTLQSQITTINGKVKTLDKDLIAIEEDFKRRQWRKFKDHCYYFETVAVKWTTAERRCREIGGYLVKIDESSEQSWVYKEAMKTIKSTHWLGMTDVVNGDWRWIYDQTTPSYKFWYSGYPLSTSNGYSKNYNCAYMASSYSGKWFDYPCSYAKPYICESNFCFS